MCKYDRGKPFEIVILLSFEGINKMKRERIIVIGNGMAGVATVEHLLKKQGVRVDYGDIASACFNLMEQVPSDRSLVHAVVRHFQTGKG